MPVGIMSEKKKQALKYNLFKKKMSVVGTPLSFIIIIYINIIR